MGIALSLPPPRRGTYPNHGYVAQRPVGDEFARLDDWGVVEEVFGRSEEGVCPTRGVGDGAHLVERSGGGLLTGYVLARVEAGDNLLRVQGRGGEEFHSVHAGVVEDVGVVGIDARVYAPLPGAALRSLRRGVAQGDHLAVFVSQVSGRVKL